jgi:cytochrome c5
MTDRAFWKFFAGLVGALAALAVVLAIVANVIGGKSKNADATAMDAKAIAERIKPVGELALATAAAPVVNALVPAANAAADVGQSTYNASCAACHAAGVAGAPKLGDKADWGPRIKQGKDKLYTHSLKGYQGKKGFMPPKGGNAALKDDVVKAAVDFMVSKAQ